ncbi:MAG: DUF4980 domain-containing protein [Bacteroidales bacterium]|nr:DUF4980 domain-containing protein [Bacteroidales bacterium]
MKIFNPALLVAAAIAAPAVSWAGISASHLGSTNTMVRLTEPQRYLLLPVQEAMPDAKVEVLVNGKPERTLYVRLADTNVDYVVPLDLEPYRGQGEVLLNIITEADRSRSREAADYVCWSAMQMTDTFDTQNTEKYRPLYHHTPLYGWMNDPNGMFYRDGEWHLYYQHNPYGSKWQNMTWGHSSSKDLVNWTHHPEAIEPDGLGTIFSGSSVVDHKGTAGFGEGTVISIYTSCAHSQVQSLAYSHDGGLTFTKYPGNPIIPNPREARDPNMFWHEPTGQWVMVLADALEHQMQIYTSANLKDWTLQSSFGKGYGAQEGVWECPDLFELPVEGTDERKWVLVCNLNPGGPFGGSATQYFVGDFDGKTFRCDTEPSVTKWMDYGKDHYATVSWSNAPDDRRVVLGWMSNWQYANDVPTMQYRSANTLPRDLGLFRADDGQLYLSVKPSAEVDGLRGKAVAKGAFSVGNGKEKSFALPEANDGVCEIEIDYAAARGKQLTLTLSNAQGEELAMLYDAEKNEFSMDRTRAGLSDFSHSFPAVTVAPTYDAQGKLRLFIDRCSVEAFDGDGRFAMTNLVFPTQPYNQLRIGANGASAKINSLKIYPLAGN